MTSVRLPLDLSEPLGSIGPEPARRSLSLFPEEAGRQRLSLSFLDGGADYPQAVLAGLLANGYYPDGEVDAGTYLIPLGESETASRDCDKEADVGLMPVRLVRLLDEESLQLQDLREGWLYVFVDGHLWREIAIGKHVVFQDVNLAKHQGKDHRPCAGMLMEHNVVSLPYRLEGRVPTLQVAFSEVQWTWAYLCKMGGMSKDDRRYLPGLAIHAPYHEIAPDAVFRNCRFQTLDLGAYRGGWDIEKLKTHYLSPATTIEEHRKSEAGKALSPLSQEDISGRVAYLAVSDPLASAREMAEEYHSLLELEDALAQQADGSGEFPLAMLIKELVEEDDKSHQSQKLREQVQMDKVEGTIEAWQQLTRRLVEQRDRADAELALKFQEPQVRAVLADYFQSGSHACHALGVIHWSLLTGACRTTNMAAYQQRVLRGEEQWLESLQRLPFPVVEQLRGMAATGEPAFNTAKDHLTKVLGPESSIPIATGLMGVISQLIEGYTQLHTDKLLNLTTETLSKVADDIVHLTGVAVQALQMPLAKAVPLGQTNPVKPGEYRFQPGAFSRAMHTLSESLVFQLLPEGKKVSAYLDTLSASPAFQRYAIRVLAPLHIINASLSINAALKAREFESATAAFSATMSALSYFGAEAEKWAKKNLEGVRLRDEEARRQIKKSEKILRHPHRHSARSQARALHRMEANQLLRDSYKAQRRPFGIAEFGGRAARHIFGAGGGLAEVVFGGWNVTKGVATGNAQVAAGGGLGVVGGALIVWGSLAGSSVVAAPLGVVLALAGGLIVLFGERSKLEEALRLGYFGQDAYPVVGGPFEEPAEAVRLVSESGLVDQSRPLPDLSEEIDYFRKLFCRVQAHVAIHRESKPSLLPMGSTPGPASEYRIIKARAEMTGYQLGQSKLHFTVSLFYEPGWFPGKSARRYPAQAMYTIPVMDGENLVALEGYIRVPKRAVLLGAEMEVSLDLLGNGSLIAPLDGPVSASSWVEDDRAIADHTWQHIENTATAPTRQPEDIH